MSTIIGYATIPILIVENDPEECDYYIRWLLSLGYSPLVATGSGNKLVAHARVLARCYYPPAAVIDMRLEDDANYKDQLGITLVQICIPPGGSYAQDLAPRRRNVRHCALARSTSYRNATD